jgi:hypothetical protein
LTSFSLEHGVDIRDGLVRVRMRLLSQLDLRFGRIVASEIEAPNMLANLVCSG